MKKNRTENNKKNQLVKLSIAAIILAVSACSPKVENRGYVKNMDWKDAVIVGKSSKQDVLEKIGSPSAKSSFGDETWYYVSSRKEGVAFLKPSLVEQEVVNIKFDASDMVSEVNIHSKDDAKDVELVKRITPTEGHSLSFIDQTLGNLGRFNKPSSGSDSVTPGRRPVSNGGF